MQVEALVPQPAYEQYKILYSIQTLIGISQEIYCGGGILSPLKYMYFLVGYAFFISNCR